MTQTVLLGDIADINMGQSPKSEFYNTAGNGLPFMQGVRSFGRMYPTIDTWCTKPTKTADKGDILFSVRAPVGDLNYAPDYMCIGRGLASLKSRNNKFLFYLLEANKERLISSQTGSIFGSVNATILKNFKLTIPKSIDEQDKIADILGTIDEKIELNRRMNETLEQMGQALFRHYFIDNPGAEKWEEVKIGELVDIKGGGTPSTKDPDFWNGSIAWTSPRDLTGKNDAYILTTDKTITEDGLAKISSGLLPKGALLLSSRAPIGYVAITGLPLAINQGYIAFLPGAYLSNHFMYFWLKHNMERIKNAANGSTFMEISKSAFRNIATMKPSEKLLQDFDIKTASLFDAMRNNQEEVQALTLLRDALLPRLISGKVKV